CASAISNVMHACRSTWCPGAVAAMKSKEQAADARLPAVSFGPRLAFRMFGRPRGALGRLGGRIMAHTNRDCGAWVAALLEIGAGQSRAGGRLRAWRRHCGGNEAGDRRTCRGYRSLTRDGRASAQAERQSN